MTRDGRGIRRHLRLPLHLAQESWVKSQARNPR